MILRSISLVHMKEIDPESPVPLYHQIAELIRSRIENGDLNRGDTLEPLREAAADWGVNFHTVRHAYAELARDGLVELRGPKGTHVLGLEGRGEPTRPRSEDLQGFLEATIRRAQDSFGLSADELVDRLSEHESSDPGPTVYVLECSEYQCQDLSQQIASAWDVEAVPWCLTNETEPPDSNLVATHFHYNEIRLRWPGRLAEASFVAISPDLDLAAEIERRRGGRTDLALTLCERDRPTADAIAADLSVVLPPQEFPLDIIVTGASERELASVEGDLLLLPPRIWGSLSAELRRDPRLVEVRYIYDPRELLETARRLDWTPTAQSAEARARKGAQAN